MFKVKLVKNRDLIAPSTMQPDGDVLDFFGGSQLVTSQNDQEEVDSCEEIRWALDLTQHLATTAASGLPSF